MTVNIVTVVLLYKIVLNIIYTQYIYIYTYKFYIGQTSELCNKTLQYYITSLKSLQAWG